MVWIVAPWQLFRLAQAPSPIDKVAPLSEDWLRLVHAPLAAQAPQSIFKPAIVASQ